MLSNVEVYVFLHSAGSFDSTEVNNSNHNHNIREFGLHCRQGFRFACRHRQVSYCIITNRWYGLNPGAWMIFSLGNNESLQIEFSEKCAPMDDWWLTGIGISAGSRCLMNNNIKYFAQQISIFCVCFQSIRNYRQWIGWFLELRYWNIVHSHVFAQGLQRRWLSAVQNRNIGEN